MTRTILSFNNKNGSASKNEAKPFYFISVTFYTSSNIYLLLKSSLIAVDQSAVRGAQALILEQASATVS